jgi:hypothetical protein
MKFSGLRRCVGLGAFAAAALVGAACGPVVTMGGEGPQEPQESFFGVVPHGQGQVREGQLTTDRGYNGTIQDLGSSIDPRTPDKAGVQGRSIPVDLAWQKMGQRQNQQGLGGSGTDTMYEEIGPEDDNDVMTRPDSYLQRLEDGRGSGPANPGSSSSGH